MTVYIETSYHTQLANFFNQNSKHVLIVLISIEAKSVYGQYVFLFLPGAGNLKPEIMSRSGAVKILWSNCLGSTLQVVGDWNET